MFILFSIPLYLYERSCSGKIIIDYYLGHLALPKLKLVKEFLHTSTIQKMPSGLVFLAEGAEEMETVITVDVLRRAGFDIVVAGVAGDGPVKCSRNVTILPDKSLKEALSKQYDILICPGGAQGSENLCKSKDVGAALQEQEKRGGYIAAICAAPTALATHHIAKGKKLTSYPGMADKFKDYKYQEERVVVDGKLITSRGPGTTFEFALAIVEQLEGKEKIQTLSNGLLLK